MPITADIKAFIHATETWMSNHHVQYKLLFNLLQLLRAKARPQKLFLSADFHDVHAVQLGHYMAQIFEVQSRKTSSLKNSKT